MQTPCYPSKRTSMARKCPDVHGHNNLTNLTLGPVSTWKVLHGPAKHRIRMTISLRWPGWWPQWLISWLLAQLKRKWVHKFRQCLIGIWGWHFLLFITIKRILPKNHGNRHVYNIHRKKLQWDLTTILLEWIHRTNHSPNLRKKEMMWAHSTENKNIGNLIHYNLTEIYHTLACLISSSPPM